MSLDLAFTQTMQNSSPQEAWQAIFAKAWQICSQPLPAHAGSEVTKRDRKIADIDYYLSTGGWDLWQHYEQAATQTSSKLIEWWNTQSSGKAVLILDALSLRELPWILAEAESRGFTISQAQATGAELPADTTSFAKALGFSQRSALGNNSAGGSHKFNGAKTESTDIAWQDCGDLIDSHPEWFFWHHWPVLVLHHQRDVRDPVVLAYRLRPVRGKGIDHALNSGEFVVVLADIPAVDAVGTGSVDLGLFFRKLGVGGQRGIDYLATIGIRDHSRAFAVLALAQP